MVQNLIFPILSQKSTMFLETHLVAVVRQSSLWRDLRLCRMPCRQHCLQQDIAGIETQLDPDKNPSLIPQIQFDPVILEIQILRDPLIFFINWFIILLEIHWNSTSTGVRCGWRTSQSPCVTWTAPIPRTSPSASFTSCLMDTWRMPQLGAQVQTDEVIPLGLWLVLVVVGCG